MKHRRFGKEVGMPGENEDDDYRGAKEDPDYKGEEESFDKARERFDQAQERVDEAEEHLEKNVSNEVSDNPPKGD